MVNPYTDDLFEVKGIGGWLVVMLVAFFGVLAALTHMVLNWTELNSLSIYVSVSVYFVLALGVLFFVLFLASYAGKSRLTQGFAIAAGIYMFCFGLMDLLFFEKLTLLGFGRFVLLGMFSLIWMLYFTLSERVENTFTKNYSIGMRSFLTKLMISIFALLAVIHIALVIMVEGIWQTILTLFVPVVSEIYWFIRMWMDQGFLNPFTSILILYVLGVVLPFFLVALYAPERD